MAQVALALDSRAPELHQLLHNHLKFLRLKGYSEYTIRNRQVHIRLFLAWCVQSGLFTPDGVTQTVLEQYQQFLLDYRKRNGRPLATRSRHSRLVPLRVWLRWMFRAGFIASNPAAELDLPRLGRMLPRQVLSAQEVERVLGQPNTRTTLGLRDRTILEVLYSTGIRRLELRNLTLSDLHFDRRIVLVREGKGKKDRYVPIGSRAVYWVRRYLKRARIRLTDDPENTSLFVSASGKRFSRDHLTWLVRRYVSKAKLGKEGACHLFAPSIRLYRRRRRSTQEGLRLTSVRRSPFLASRLSSLSPALPPDRIRSFASSVGSCNPHLARWITFRLLYVTDRLY